MTLPIVGDINPFSNPFTGSGRAATIDPKLPETLNQLQQKWASLSPYLDEVSADATNSIFDMDRQRIMRGQKPLGTKDTARALLAANSGQTITPQPGRSAWNVLGNAASDVGNIAQGIFKLPFAAAHEVTQLPHFFDAIQNGEGNIAQRVLKAPGIRFLPGAYTAANLAGGDIHEILTHPVMTALDVLPYANKFAAGTEVAKAAEAADIAEGIRPRAPVVAALTNTINDAGELSRTRVGEIIDLAGQSPIGRYVQGAIGRISKSQERERAYGAAALQEAGIPDAPIDQRLAGYEDVVNHWRSSVKDLNSMPGMKDNQFRVDVTRMAETDDLTNATPEHLAVLARARELATEREAIVLSHGIAMRAPSVGGQVGELYDVRTAQDLWKQQTDLTQRSQMTSIVNHIANGTGDVDALLQRSSDVLGAPVVDRKFGGTVGATKRGVLEQKMAGSISKSAKLEEIKAISYAVDSAGVDASPIRATLRKWQVGRATDAELQSAIDQVQTTKTPRDPATVESHWETKGKAKLQQQYTDKKLANETAAMDKAHKRALPDRFEPLVQETVRQKAREQWVNQAASPEQAAQLSGLIAQNRFSELPGFDQQWLSDTTKEVARTWQDMRDAGADPMFSHHARESQVTQMMHPFLSEVPIEIKQAKQRVLDFTPYVNDLVASFAHGDFEILKRHVQENYVQTFRDRGILKPRSEVEAMFRDKAERATGLADPRIASYQTRLQKLSENQYVPFEPEKYGMNWSSKRLSQLAAEDLMIPRYLADNFKRSLGKEGPTLAAAWDPVMRVFRTSVLALSPRWHVGNIVAGAILTTAEAGLGAWKHAGDAWQVAGDATRMAEDGALVSPDALYRTLPDDVRHSFAVHQSAFSDIEGLNAAAGRSLGNKYLQVLSDQLGKGPRSPLEEGILSKAKGKFDAFTEASYAFNQKVDMFYRSMAYLRGESLGEAKGLSLADRQAAGMELSRNVLQDWAAQTPIERGIFRSVFPFYSYISFIMRYALRYPIDHPVRASIVNSVTNAELDDMAAGLPPRFLGSIFFGGANARGQTLAFQPGGLNPFKDVGGYFTPAGFLSAMNPAFETILQQAGVKMGKADPYPELVYNQQTGQLEAHRPSIIGSAINNVIPQSQLVTYFMGRNADLTDQFRRDPEGATARLLGTVGIPQPFRHISIPGEVARNELNLSNAAGMAQTNALQSGSDAMAARYPSVAAVLTKIRSMQSSNQTTQYEPTEAQIDQATPATIPTAIPTTRPNSSPINRLSV